MTGPMPHRSALACSRGGATPSAGSSVDGHDCGSSSGRAKHCTMGGQGSGPRRVAPAGLCLEDA